MQPFRTAEIIAVGSELLTPFRADTNSLTLTTRLNELGVSVTRKAIVGDDVAALDALVREAVARADLVVTTGGLGPTEDDVTREAVQRALDRPMREDASIVASIEARFARRGIPMPAINRRQGQVPAGAIVLANPVGTAPGLWIDVGERAVVLLPGPPRELRAILDGDLGPRLLARSGGRRLHRRVIRTTGRAESVVDELASPIYGPWLTEPVAIETTILAAAGQIELHLSASGSDAAAIERRLADAVTSLTAALGDIVYSTDGRSLEQIVIELLAGSGRFIAVAESCTGGGILMRLTDVPGSSRSVRGGFVAYDNAVKREQLGVPAELIEEHGAVSEEVAVAMADSVRSALAADVGASVTGIAGPTGGSAEKPIGTVVIAVSMSGAPPQVRRFLFLGDRQMVRTQATLAALDMVRRALL